MESFSNTKELLSLYETVCKRQQKSLLRNSSLLKDVERIQRLLFTSQNQHLQLNILRGRYQQYVASIYPHWVLRCREQCGNQEPGMLADRVATNTVTAPYHVTLVPGHVTSTTHSITGKCDVMTAPSHVTSAPSPVMTAPALVISAPYDATAHVTLPTLPVATHTSSVSTHLKAMRTYPSMSAPSLDTVTISAASSTSLAHTKSIPTIGITSLETIQLVETPHALKDVDTPQTDTSNAEALSAPFPATSTTPTVPVIEQTKPPTVAMSWQPDSLTPKQLSLVDKSMDLSLSTYSLSSEKSLQNNEHTADMPVVDASFLPSPGTSLNSQHHFPHTCSPSQARSPVASNTPSQHHSPPGTPSQHLSPPGTSSQHPSPPCTPSQHHSPPGTPSQHHSPPGTPSQHSPPGTSSHHPSPARTPSHHSPPGTPSQHSSPPGSSQKSLMSSLLSLTIPVHSSALPPVTPSPPLPPPTPTRVSSLPPPTPSHPHRPSQTSHNVDKVKVVINLLTTLNNHLLAEGQSVAMEMYAEPEEDSDKMKLKISSSNVLFSNITKYAELGLDCTTWDVSVLGVVLLHQLSLLSATQGSPIPHSMLSKDAPLITQPIDVSCPWSQLWETLLKHIHLLHSFDRPLDELAAIFTPALFTTATEKACLQLLALFSLMTKLDQEASISDHKQMKQQDGLPSTDSNNTNMKGNRQEQDSSHKDYSDTEDSHTENLPGLQFGQHSSLTIEQQSGLLNYGTLGGGELSEHSSLLSEGSAVLELEKELKISSPLPVISQTMPQVSHQDTPVSSDENSIDTPPVYVPTALESSAPHGPSQMSNNSSLKRRLGFFDDSDSELEEASDLLTSKNKPPPDDDFDFHMASISF